MKMTKQAYEMIKIDMDANRQLILNHKEWLLNDGKYKVFENRFGWDIYHGVVKTDTKNVIQKEYLNDRHITTAIVKALKELELL